MFQLKLLIMILLGGFCTILSARAGLELCSSKVSRVLVIFFLTTPQSAFVVVLITAQHSAISLKLHIIHKGL